MSGCCGYQHQWGVGIYGILHVCFYLVCFLHILLESIGLMLLLQRLRIGGFALPWLLRIRQYTEQVFMRFLSFECSGGLMLLCQRLRLGDFDLPYLSSTSHRSGLVFTELV
jgi:hypothetical protein